MNRILRKSPRNLGVLGFAVAAVLAAFLIVSTTVPASAELEPSSGIFTGTDDDGDFQAALEDAVAQAATAAGCCGIVVEYEVLETKGTYGGFVFTNEVRVKIYAKW